MVLAPDFVNGQLLLDGGGTSPAAAHIAGLCAAAKGAVAGWGVFDVSMYFRSNHSVCLPSSADPEGMLLNGWKRIRLDRSPSLAC